jgi:hypothetical protein
MKNYNYSKIDGVKEYISDAELNESIVSLKKCVEQENFNKKEDNIKILHLKAVYELGVYYFYNNKYEEANKYFIFLEKNMKIYPEFQKYLYFNLISVTNLIKYINNKNDNNKIEKNSLNNQNLITLEDTNQIINEDYQKYKNEIENSTKEIKDIIKSKEETKEKYENGMIKNLKISEYLFYMTFENINNYQKLNKFIMMLNNINNINEENIYIRYIKKEISYHLILFQILESLKENKKELPKLFIINLSNTIQQNTFTDSLSLSGMIHSSMINFEADYKIIYKYFNDFVEFFHEINTSNKEIINQIIFIARIMSVIYIIQDSKSKINSLGEKEIIINIEKELHTNIINIFLFWLEKDKNKNELKYIKYINIIYILINTLKIVDYLKIYKIIVLAVLEFLLNKKISKNKSSLNKIKENNKIILFNNINDYIKKLKPKIFKVNSLSEEELKYNKKEINSQNLYFSIRVNFIEEKDNNNKIISQNDTNFEFYINKLFEIIELIEEKIKQYEYKEFERILALENSENNFDMSIYPKIFIKKDFLYSFYKILDNENMEKNKISNILLIKEGIDYINDDLSKIKFIYMKNDLINNYNYDINNLYELFKKSINQEILSKLILSLINNNLILESIVFVQYSKYFNQNFEYALIRAFYDSKKDINNDCCKYIWKTTYFEYLANISNKNNDRENLEKIKIIIKKIGNHRFFKDNPLRKHYKIINFFNFLEYINSTLFNV